MSRKSRAAGSKSNDGHELFSVEDHFSEAFHYQFTVGMFPSKKCQLQSKNRPVHKLEVLIHRQLFRTTLTPLWVVRK